MALFIFLLLFTLPCLIISETIPTTFPEAKKSIGGFTKIWLPPNVESTGSLAFDTLGDGPYTATFDGRVVKYNKIAKTFQDIAYTSPNRTKAYCDGSKEVEKAEICGLPVGLSIDTLTGTIYITDLFLGISSVGSSGGLASILLPTKNGAPYHLLFVVDFAKSGKLYFTDASGIYGVKEVAIGIKNKDLTGRLLEYDTKTKKVTELLTQLGGPVGVATTSDASLLFVSEFTAKRIIKYYLKGPKAGTSEIFLTFSGNPDKIQRVSGEENFWVPVNEVNDKTGVAPQAVKFSWDGKILAKLDLSKDYNQLITVVYQQGQHLFVSGHTLFIGRYDLGLKQ